MSKRLMAMICIAALLAGCGGGGGKGKKQPAPTAPTPPAATVTVAVSSAPISQSLDYGDNFSTALDGTWSGTNLGNASVYLQVSDSGNIFTMPAAQIASGTTFHFTLNLATNAQAGDRTGTLTVKACKDAACTQPYSGTSSASVTYRLQIAAIGEWETVQRDASHNGYIPITLDASRFAKAWEWTFPKDAAAIGTTLSRPATAAGKAYITASNFSVDSTYGVTLFALDESTGNVAWSQAVPPPATVLSPAASGGVVYVPTRNGDAAYNVYDGATGALRFKYTPGALATASLLAPTFFAGNAYFFAGYDGNEIHAANSLTGARLWSRPRDGLLPTTPAVDQNFVYYHTGTVLQMLDRQTGNPVAGMLDLASDGSRNPSSTAPILSSRGHAIVNSYSRTGRKLSIFDLANRGWVWSSNYSYRAVPAVADGVIYAMRIESPTLDAIDETNGSTLWSWTPPPGDAQTYSIDNIVATKNLLFVSTGDDVGHGNLWAIDRTTHQVVWRYPEPGYIVISANRTLYLVGEERVVAFKLR